MTQNKHQIQAMLDEAGLHPRHRFGQNFMIDQNLVRLVSAAGDLGPRDCAIEVGPGTGTLTEELVERAAEVIAVEIDHGLADLLRSRLGGHARFRLVEGDALAGKHALNRELLESMDGARGRGLRLKLVANLPYNIASPLVIELLRAGVDVLAFTVQKEVAERLRAPHGSDDYGPLSVMAQLLAHVQVLRMMPPQAFWPPPKIESALVHLVREDRLGERAAEFTIFVHALFSFRRKTLRNALRQAGHDSEKILAATGFDEKCRPEEFSPQQLLEIFVASDSAGPGSP